MATFTFDPVTRTLLIESNEFWTPAMLAAFTAEALARAMAIRLRHGQFALLADGRGAPVQPGYVIDGLAALMPKALKLTSEPMAVVVSSVLNKIQIERYHKGPNCRVFLDMDEARAWIVTERGRALVDAA